MRTLVISCFCLLAAVFGSGFLTPCWAGIDTGLSVYFPFAGTAMDQSGHERDGKVHGAVLVQDRFNFDDGAYGFDGNDDWLEISDLKCMLNYDRDWSINVWAYLDGTGRHEVFFAGADGDAGSKQFVVSSMYVKMSHKADSESDWRVNFKEAIHDTWHMYTVTWKQSGHLQVYVDGVLLGEDLAGELADFCPDNFPIIGAVNFQNKTQFFKGRIGEFRIYDRVLSDLEIQKLLTVVVK